MNKYKNRKIRKPYQATTPPKSKNKKTKQHKFVSKNQSEAINQKAINMEQTSVTQKNILLGTGILIGLVLAILDIRDDGMMLEIIGTLKYQGSLVGFVIIVLCVCGIINNNPDGTME